MLLNGVLNFAVSTGMERIYVANSDWALAYRSQTERRS